MKQIYLLFMLLISVSLNAQNALHFDGTNDSVIIPDSNALDLLANDDMTIEFWFKTTDNTSFVPLLSKADDANNQVGYAVSMYSGIIGVAKIGDGGGAGLVYAQINTTIAFNDGNWHHFTAVLPGTDANNYSIYIDETLQTTTIASNNFAGEMVNSVDLLLGKFTNDYYQGIIDELRIWEKALSASEIIAMSTTELAGTETDLVAYYQFNEGVANGSNSGINTLPDLTSNSNTGDLDKFSLNGTASNWVDGFLFLPLSNPNITKEDSISLFPNPAKDVITISGTRNSQQYTIFNIDGKEITTGITNINSSIDTQNLSTGFYILKFENGNALRFMKE